MRIMRGLALFLFTCTIHIGAAAEVNSQKIFGNIKLALVPLKPAAAPPKGAEGAPGASDQIRQDRLERLKLEIDASQELRTTCDGRFNVMRFDLKRSVTRSEWISVGGGLLGVFGAIATCPHCAAIGAGLAGLANPMQQTFKDNEDSPEAHRAKLLALSEKINGEFEEYRKLPPADVDLDDFEKNLRARLDGLLTVMASCQYYEARMAPPAK